MITMMMGTLHLFLYSVNTPGKKPYARGHYYGQGSLVSWSENIISLLIHGPDIPGYRDGMFGPVIPLITGIIGLKIERLSFKSRFQIEFLSNPYES